MMLPDELLYGGLFPVAPVPTHTAEYDRLMARAVRLEKATGNSSADYDESSFMRGTNWTAKGIKQAFVPEPLAQKVDHIARIQRIKAAASVKRQPCALMIIPGG